jgi:pyridoxamine 5'-phosphate oxidase
VHHKILHFPGMLRSTRHEASLAMNPSTPSNEAPGSDPLAIFLEWHKTAVERGLPDPDAFALATATPDGRPSVRIVLFKGIADGALRLVTNYESRKGEELAKNAHGALVFYWHALGRQVRMEGFLERASASESDAYFASRDRESQLGAWASAQSRPVESRAALFENLERVRARFREQDVPRPPHWGMLKLVPERVELWLAGQHRLHDRFAYTRDGAGWRVERLAP